MISVAEAIQIVKEQTSRLESENVPLVNALGRYLAQDIIADSDLPPFNRAQMDGYAVRAAEIQDATPDTPSRLRIAGESAAGRGWHNEMGIGEAVRIMTGAPVPRGADSVQQVELTREVDGSGVVEILRAVETGRSIVARGSEIKAGETVLRAGEQINAAMTAVLASFGYAEVKVGRRPRAAVLATGTELVEVNKQPAQDQIRDSNTYSLSAYATQAGGIVERLPLAGDDIEILKEQIERASKNADLLVASGGVSMGVYDFTKATLKELKAVVFFERVALRPGKPTVFARLPNGSLVFGLPGNPVSVSVTFNLFARTALLAMQGARELTLEEQSAILERSVKGSEDRESYLPARLKTDQEGHLTAEPLKWGGSSDFVAFAKATALIKVPAGVKAIEPGTTVRVVRLPG
jgi:molybdopterin molybdotransferase